MKRFTADFRRTGYLQRIEKAEMMDQESRDAIFRVAWSNDSNVEMTFNLFVQ